MKHVFDVELAAVLGIEKAIILENFSYWFSKNLANERNIVDGRVYTYNSYDALAKIFPYMKKNTIANLIRELEKLDILRSRSDLNPSSWDHTKWYCFGDNPLVEEFFGTDFIRIDESEVILDNIELDDSSDSEPSSTDSDSISTEVVRTSTDIVSSFQLSHKKAYPNLSEAYRKRLFAFCLLADGAANFDAFTNRLRASGYAYTNYAALYLTWYKIFDFPSEFRLPDSFARIRCFYKSTPYLVDVVNLSYQVDYSGDAKNL